MTTAISIILGLLKAIPVLDSWMKALYAAYVKMKIEAHDKDFIEAHIALLKGSQIPLEEAIGSPTAGKPNPKQDELVTRPHV